MKNAPVYTLIAIIVILAVLLSPLKAALAAPEPAPPRIGFLTVGAIIGGALLAKSLIGDLIGDAGAEARETLRETERILDELIAKLRENYEEALDVTLDKLDEFSRNQLELIHGLVQDILIDLELAFEDINQTILEDIEIISLEMQARISQIQDVAVVVVRGTILIIDKAAFNLSFVIDLIIFAVGLLVFIVLMYTRKIPTDKLRRNLAIGGIALFLAIFGFFLFPQGRAYALTFSGFGEQIQSLERPDIFQVRPNTLIIGDTTEVFLTGTRLAPGGQPPTVQIAGVEAPVVTSDELVIAQVGGLDLSDHLGRQTITLSTENGLDTELITILAAPPPPPDLVITGFTIEPASPQQDELAEATITVSNQGSGSATGFRVRWQPTAALSGDVNEVSGLAPGESKEIPFTFTYISAGDFQSVAIADPFGEVEESDETNNTATLNLSVRSNEPQQPPTRTPPPGPSCEEDCAAERDFCMQEGLLLPSQCVQLFKACLNMCP